MKRIVLAATVAVLTLILVYAGLFARLVWVGRFHSQARNITNGYVLADPGVPGGVASHARRSQVFAPLVMLTGLGGLQAFPTGLLKPLPRAVE